MGVARILRSRLAEAKRSGAKTVELEQLDEDEVEELAAETLAYLRSRPSRPSSTSGWTVVAATKAGVIGWWGEEAGLRTESQRRSLRPLRRQIYDLLDERGLIVKPVSPGAVVEVSPVSDMAPAAEAAEPEAAEPKAAETEAAEAAEPVAAEPEAAEAAEPEAEGAEPEPAEPEAAEPEAAEPEAAEAEGAEPAEAEAAEPESVGAWVLRADPTVWDLARFVADGHDTVSTWAVEDAERSATMSYGQRVFLWAGGDGTLIAPGFWGVGWVVGPCQWRSVPDGYWVDPEGNRQVGLFADVSIQLLPQPLSRQEVLDDPKLSAIEVVRDPFGSNPSSLTSDEADAVLALAGFDPPALSGT